MGVEIERKFLVDHEKWHQLEKPAGVHYQQGYILNDNNRTVRVRITDTQGYITLKGSGTSHMSRAEYEYEIPLKDGRELLKEFTKNGTEKTRYRIPYDGFTWEVDEFLGDNKGLIVAEIELEDEHDEFEKPYWVTKEVTDDARYFNSNLAVHPFKDWD
ncbi:CYTH domain-containing protein [Mucilaginibacter pocheonensis]|uniref:CYTH domain-containing protein n=1 Tax=Mucilaginibacter pocheonensis TaxID=398050 RepID=A0ABU1TI83_9SPHI|nr:CYTH domain-containing protein [Mucilaginibacter pocheonensis]MDR6945117.1 CYTH domain-containing protein [Mucilaginibacter pocheonensis]